MGLANIAVATTPYVSTLPPAELRANSAKLIGMVVPNGTPSWAWFEWGPPGALTNRTPTNSVGAGFCLVLVKEQISLTRPVPSGLYECRLVVGTNALVRAATGARQRFTTGSPMAAWGDSQYDKTVVPAGLSNVVLVAGGWNQSFAITPEGSLRVWGDNTYGQTNIPLNVTNWVGVSGGQYHALALKADGKPMAWGFNMFGQASVPITASNLVMVSAGSVHNVALKADGKVMAWGDNSYGQKTVPTGLSNVVAVAAAVGGNHNLALRANGTVSAWGHNHEGQTTVPGPLTNLVTANAVAVAAGASHSLALRADGTVVAWGLNSSGQTNVPAGLSGVVAIAAGVSHSLALKSNGAVVAWGGNLLGQTNLPPGLQNVARLAAGNDHSLAVGGFNALPRALSQFVQAGIHRDWVIALQGSDPAGDAVRFRLTALPGEGAQYRLYQCTANGGRGARIRAGDWVSNALGRVVFEPVSRVYGKAYGSLSFVANDGQNDSETAAVVVDVEQFLSFTLPPSEVHTNTARLWGLAAPDGLPTWTWFEWGQDLGEWAHASSPMFAGDGVGLVRTNVQVEGLAAGELYKCRLVVSNVLGVRRAMQRQFTTGRRPVVWGGTAQYGQTNVPVGLGNAVTLVSGGFHLLAVDALGAVKAWGNPSYGLTSTNVMVTLRDPLAMAASTFHNVVVRSNGSVVAWGDNSWYQTNVPAGLSDVVMVGAGDKHSLALRADGTVVAWGSGGEGQAVVPEGLRDVVAVAAGDLHSVALRGDGRVVAWGKNNSVPADLSNVVAVAGGALHTLALRADGTAAAWGDNAYGQCNVPAELANQSTNPVVAIEAGAFHSLVIRSDGTLLGWGQTGWGQLAATGFAETAAELVAGKQHSALLGEVNPTAIPQVIRAEPNTNLIITLQSRYRDGDPVSFIISNLPTGALYQYIEAAPGGLGLPITEAGTVVTDANGRLVFAPPPDGIGISHDIFSFAVSVRSTTSPATNVTRIAYDPTIVTQPPPSEVNCGGTATLSVAAVGTLPPRYQWYFANQRLAGKTSPILTLTNVTYAAQGNYYVVATNANGTTTSIMAALTVVDTVAPIVTLLGPNPMTLQLYSVFSDPGATARDACQGNVVPATNGLVDTNVPGNYLVEYVATDASGNSSTAVRTVIVLPPQVLAQVTSPLGASVLTAVIVTNIVRPQPPPGSFRFALCGAPAGAEINPTNGIFKWTPTLAQSHQNFTVTVCVTNVGLPAWTTSTSFAVVVDPYLRLSLGTAVVKAGSTGSVPVQVSASTSFSNLISVVLVSDEHLRDLRLINPTNGLPVGEIITNGLNEWIMTFSPNQLVAEGDSLLADLQFVAAPSETSAFVPLVPSRVTAMEAGGIPIRSTLTSAGRVMVIGSLGTGLLEALPPSNAAPSLAVYGAHGSNYVIQATTELVSPQWHPVWGGIMSNVMSTNVVLPSLRLAPGVFFRLLRP